MKNQQHRSTDRDPATNRCKEAYKDLGLMNKDRVFEHKNKMKMPKNITSNNSIREVNG